MINQKIILIEEHMKDISDKHREIYTMECVITKIKNQIIQELFDQITGEGKFESFKKFKSPVMAMNIDYDYIIGKVLKECISMISCQEIKIVEYKNILNNFIDFFNKYNECNGSLKFEEFAIKTHDYNIIKFIFNYGYPMRCCALWHLNETLYYNYLPHNISDIQLKSVLLSSWGYLGDNLMNKCLLLMIGISYKNNKFRCSNSSLINLNKDIILMIINILINKTIYSYCAGCNKMRLPNNVELKYGYTIGSPHNPGGLCNNCVEQFCDSNEYDVDDESEADVKYQN